MAYSHGNAQLRHTSLTNKWGVYLNLSCWGWCERTSGNPPRHSPPSEHWSPGTSALHRQKSTHSRWKKRKKEKSEKDKGTNKRQDGEAYRIIQSKGIRRKTDLKCEIMQIYHRLPFSWAKRDASRKVTSLSASRSFLLPHRIITMLGLARVRASVSQLVRALYVSRL